MWPFESRIRELRANPLPKYWTTVHVVLEAPLPVSGSSECAVAYYRHFGLACSALELKQLISSLVTDGEVDWEKTSYEPVDPRKLDRETRKRIEPTEGAGVWFSSGRVFHGAG